MENEKQSKSRVLTCVYCGMEYPQDTPAWGEKVLTDHIKICEKHPLRDAEIKIQKLRSALIGLIGSEDPETLNQMELNLRLLPAPEADKIASINAIHTILETMP